MKNDITLCSVCKESKSKHSPSWTKDSKLLFCRQEINRIRYPAYIPMNNLELLQYYGKKYGSE